MQSGCCARIGGHVVAVVGLLAAVHTLEILSCVTLGLEYARWTGSKVLNRRNLENLTRQNKFRKHRNWHVDAMSFNQKGRNGRKGMGAIKLKYLFSFTKTLAHANTVIVRENTESQGKCVLISITFA